MPGRDQHSLTERLVPAPFGSRHERVTLGDAHFGFFKCLIEAGYGRGKGNSFCTEVLAITVARIYNFYSEVF